MRVENRASIAYAGDNSWQPESLGDADATHTAGTTVVEARADRAARYADRANRANAPPQQHHLAKGIALDN